MARRYQLMLMIINRPEPFCSETLQLIPSDLTKGFCREMKHAESNIHSPELLWTTFTLFTKYSEWAPANYQLHNIQFSNPAHLTRTLCVILHVWQLIPRRIFSINLQYILLTLHLLSYFRSFRALTNNNTRLLYPVLTKKRFLFKTFSVESCTMIPVTWIIFNSHLQSNISLIFSNLNSIWWKLLY